MLMVTPSVCRSCSSIAGGYFSYTATEDQLEQAKSWYNQMMDPQKRAKRSSRRLCPRRCSRKCRTSREMNGANLPSITLKEVLAYRDTLKSGARPEFMVIGNMTEARQQRWHAMCKNSWR